MSINLKVVHVNVIIIYNSTLIYSCGYNSAYTANPRLRALLLPESNITIRNFPSIAMVTPNNHSIIRYINLAQTAVYVRRTHVLMNYRIPVQRDDCWYPSDNSCDKKQGLTDNHASHPRVSAGKLRGLSRQTTERDAGSMGQRGAGPRWTRHTHLFCVGHHLVKMDFCTVCNPFLFLTPLFLCCTQIQDGRVRKVRLPGGRRAYLASRYLTVR